jgi:hypothetical protein
MASGATSLNLVRDELFATMEEAELSLEHFIADRQNGSLLQQAVESLKQVRGALNLIELVGAELLAQEVLDQATDIPAGAGSDRDGQLASLSNALHVLRRYLESLGTLRLEIPELLLPAINDLRQAGGQAPLPESFFFSVRLDHPRLERTVAPVTTEERLRQQRRLRQMYQVGLLGFIREQGVPASLKWMSRALSRIEALYANEPIARLCWVGAAALEAQADAQLLPRKGRKQLFSRIDRELKQLLVNSAYEPPRSLLKELLYLVALADSQGPLASNVREVFGLNPLPFTDHMLEEEYQRLSGPGQAVMRSLSSAIREELTSVKDMLDLAERGNLPSESLKTLHNLLGTLEKTLSMVGLSSAANMLNQQLACVQQWVEGESPQPEALNRLAETVLYVESMVATLERGELQGASQTASAPVSDSDSFAAHQLNEARIVVVDESQAGLAMAKRSITAYLESSGDKLHLANVPFSLQAVRGGLWFLNQPRAAELVGACSDYITRHMLETPQVPSEQMLETLADALSSLEYYLEAGAVLRPETQPSVLDLAAESVSALGMKVA